MGVLPAPSGPHRVGVVEVDVPAPTPAGRVPCAIYYPAQPKSATDAKPKQLRWLPPGYAAAIGEAQLGDMFGATLGSALMAGFGPLATGYETVRAEVSAPPLTAEGNNDEPWPAAVFSHGLTGWRHVCSSFIVEIASRGAVVVAVEHCDGSACVAVGSEEDGGKTTVLAKYVSWEREKIPELKRAGVDDVGAATREWRREQCDQRRVELHAALDGVRDALRRALGVSVDVRADRDCAVVGQSFGGSAALSCVLADGASNGTTGSRARFSRCLAFDPWIEGDDDDAVFPLRPEHYAAGFSPALRRLTVWRNGRWDLAPAVAKHTDRLGENFSGSDGTVVVHDCKDCDHFAQTDVPVVFERGPLSFVYRVLKGGGSSKDDKSLDALTFLLSARAQTVAALDGWLVGEPADCEPGTATA
mmetsp:Transcript_1037/g.4108  ORF Transcript_1037/g.4108 Transcript_1037/m.4108 type:complete len:416 (-) Transcript_1037:200-1447(-)